jgi:hypothetical protein
MATKTTTPDPYLYPPVDPELLAQMREIYARYTGYQVAAVIRQIRAEIEEAKANDLL